MPEVTINVGGRVYRVACGAGEENHLKKAAAVLDGEAARLAASGQKLPETTVLLMAGLMVSDQVVGGEGASSGGGSDQDERVRKLEEELSKVQRSAAAMKSRLERAKQERPDLGSDEKIATLTEERDAARAEAATLREDLDAAKSEDGAGSQNADHALLERMASELERLADEMEASAKAS